MVFVEVFRLLAVVVGVIAGVQTAEHSVAGPSGVLLGATLGALCTYVIGGLVGRLVDRGLQHALVRLKDTPPAAVFAGSVVGTTGLLLGVAAAMALSSAVRSPLVVPAGGALAWVLCVGGIRIGVTKGEEVLRAVGMAHLVQRPVVRDAIVVDTSALFGRHLLVLGRSGLLAGGVLVPRVVLDEAHLLSSSPDELTARKAGRALELLTSLRRAGVDVEVVEDDLTEHGDFEAKVVAVAQRRHCRIATCTMSMITVAERAGVDVVRLYELAGQLAPDHLVGEHLSVALVKEGRLEGQAVGYLPEGDMVVVNAAAHLVGVQDVGVVVSGVRPTSQGVLLFAEIDDAAVPA
ncbi:MAG: PIN domain-containing protein [Acidimicrobiales bacterium]